MTTAGSLYRNEILEQPEALERLLKQGRSGVQAVAESISKFSPDYVTIAARGSSDNAARYGQYIMGARNRLSVGLAVPSLFTLYNSPPTMKRSLAIGISQSGQSPDIVAVLEEARRQGGATIAITNDPNSPLAKSAEHTIALLAGDEKAVAATKTYTTELMAIAMLSAALDGTEDTWKELAGVPEQVQKAIDFNSSLGILAERFRAARHFVVLGRGFNYCTAFEIALKIKETSYLVAEPYSVADLLHGPVAMIDRGFPVLLVAPTGKAMADVPALQDLLIEREAEVIALSDDEKVLKRAQGGLRLPNGIPEWLSSIVAVVPGQLWAGALASAAGLDPDAPRGLSKVTLTR